MDGTRSAVQCLLTDPKSSRQFRILRVQSNCIATSLLPRGKFTCAYRGESRSVELLGAGQKSGVYWALNPDDGNVVWATLVGPGGTLGGIEWGSATDGQRVYVAIANNSHRTYQFAVTGEMHNAGSWAALEAATGRILWQVKVPGVDPRNPSFGDIGLGVVSVANGVMYAGSMSGQMVALDAATGAMLKNFSTNGSVICGPSIVNGVVYWGSGYGRVGGKPNTSGPQLFAFHLN